MNHQTRAVVLYSEDRDLVATVAELIAAPLYRTDGVHETVKFAREISGGGVPCFGPDVADYVATIANWRTSYHMNGLVLHTGRRKLNSQGIYRLAVRAVLELPLELDFLHDHLGLTVPLVRNVR